MWTELRGGRFVCSSSGENEGMYFERVERQENVAPSAWRQRRVLHFEEERAAARAARRLTVQRLSKQGFAAVEKRRQQLFVIHSIHRGQYC